MQKQENNPALESKKVPDLFKNLKTAFEEAFEHKDVNKFVGKILSVIGKKKSNPLLTPKTAELGLLLINELDEFKESNTYWVATEPVTYKSKRYNRIEELLGAEEWKHPENYNLLIFIFGAEKAGYARHAWDEMPNQMYQTGYSRRSFRSPRDREIFLVNQINFIVSTIPQAYTMEYKYDLGTERTCYDLSLVDQVKYNHLVGDSNTGLFRLWSAAIDLGNTEVLKQLEEIIFNRDEEGKITRSIIKALLNSNKEEAWILVGKLLLAAQRQEGLRQTILESLDETSIGALKYMISLIVDNQLGRFSSVVRAIDVWAGLGWESERESTVRNFLEKAQIYLEDSE